MNDTTNLRNKERTNSQTISWQISQAGYSIYESPTNNPRKVTMNRKTSNSDIRSTDENNEYEPMIFNGNIGIQTPQSLKNMPDNTT